MTATIADSAMRVPVTLVAGHLGSGKTTLLNRVLGDAGGRRIAVLVNDFNALNIDAALIASRTDDVIALQNGCICCSLRDDLAFAVARVARLNSPPDHILIEASGVSDPVAIAETLFAPLLAEFVRVDGMIAVLDAENYADLSFADGERVLAQAAVSDLALVNKTDVADVHVLARLLEDLAVAAPAVRVIETVHCRVPVEIVIGIGAGRLPPADPRSGHTHPVAHGFVTWSWSSAAALSLDALCAAVPSWPRSVYRAKGIVCLAGHEAPAIFQLVGKRSSMVPSTPGAQSRASAIVFVGRATPEEQAQVSDSLDACMASAST